MAKYLKHKASEQVNEEALKIARGTQQPGQTKEQTKLIARGIKKGIEQYKKKQNEKARELDKKLKKVNASAPLPEPAQVTAPAPDAVKQPKLPWILLILSWLGFAAYIYISV